MKNNKIKKFSNSVKGLLFLLKYRSIIYIEQSDIYYFFKVFIFLSLLPNKFFNSKIYYIFINKFLSKTNNGLKYISKNIMYIHIIVNACFNFEEINSIYNSYKIFLYSREQQNYKKSKRIASKNIIPEFFSAKKFLYIQILNPIMNYNNLKQKGKLFNIKDYKISKKKSIYSYNILEKSLFSMYAKTILSSTYLKYNNKYNKYNCLFLKDYKKYYVLDKFNISEENNIKKSVGFLPLVSSRLFIKKSKSFNNLYKNKTSHYFKNPPKPNFLFLDSDYYRGV